MSVFNKKIIIGSRGSELALWQANYAKDELLKAGFDSQIKIIHTKGDKELHLTFDKLEGKGFFTKELENALLNGEIDLAVHSHKDLATEEVEGLIVGAVSYRDNPADWMLIHQDHWDASQLFELAQNALVGTSSPRRVSQMRYFRPDLYFTPIRGNVATRVGKIGIGCDAVILAAAGLSRLKMDLSNYKVLQFDPWIMIPAPAQGVLAYQIRLGDEYIATAISNLHNQEIKEVIDIERAILSGLGAGCQQPVGVYTRKQKDNSLYETWCSWAPDVTTSPKRFFITSDEPSTITRTIINKIRSNSQNKVFITRELDDRTLRSFAGMDVLIQGKSLVEFEPINIVGLPVANWLFFQSRKGVEYFSHSVKKIPMDTKIACYGSGTAESFKAYYPENKVDYIGSGSDAETIIAELKVKIQKDDKIAIIRGKQSQESIAKALKGLSVQDSTYSSLELKEIQVYENKKASSFTKPEADILIFTSPMNVEAYTDKYEIPNDVKIIAIGHTTAASLSQKGYSAIVPIGPEPWHLAEHCH